ncbi:MAG: NAD-dependent epimerase/dehydratase family protein [Candidatus Promineifilaceae bacterium]
MRVAVTGATGFLGAALCRQLVADGHSVVAISRNALPQPGLPLDNLTLRSADVTQLSTLTTVFDGCDWVIHAAGRLGAFGISEDAYTQLHVNGTRNVLTAAHKAGALRILHVSSPGAVGPTVGTPKDESAKYEPSNRYERSKASAEKVALQLSEQGVPVIVVRPEFVYGPTDLHVLNLFRAVAGQRVPLINGGRSYCHPTYIDDAVEGMLLALINGRIGEIYQVAGEESIPMRAFLSQIADELGVPAPRLNAPRRLLKPLAEVAERVGTRTGITPPLTQSAVDFFSTSYRFSWAKAADELGYRPKTTLQNGIRQTVAWYRANGYLKPVKPATSMQHLSVTGLYPFALAEGEGVGTAYEYFVKRGALRAFLADKQPKSILIAGLPQKYGHSSDFLLLAHELGAALTVIDERPEKLASTEMLLERLQADGHLQGLAPTWQAVDGFDNLPFSENQFDLVISSEVVQRLEVDGVLAFSAEIQRIGHHFAVFCPNGDNSSHVGLSGLNGLTLSELRRHFGESKFSGLIDMPPFPPGIALSQEQRESAESGLIQQVAMYVLQLYSYVERPLPARIRRQFAHIVYVFR